MARELGLDDATLGLVDARSPADVVHADDTAPLIRLHAAGYLPSDLLENRRALTEVATQVWANDELPAFQALVRRNAPIRHEVLKAYLLCAFVIMFGGYSDFVGITVSNRARIRVVDQIAAQSRVIDGDAADATFQFGREAQFDCS